MKAEQRKIPRGISPPRRSLVGSLVGTVILLLIFVGIDHFLGLRIGHHFLDWAFPGAAVWMTWQYGRQRRKQELEKLSTRWSQHALLNQASTAKEPTEWLNKLLAATWPNSLEPRLMDALSLQEMKPHMISRVEVRECALGPTAPEVGLGTTHWSTDANGQESLHAGFKWDSSDLRVVLALHLAAPFQAAAVSLVVNSIFVRGKVRVVPVLDGQGLLYAFDGEPELALGAGFAGGSHSVPFELSAFTTWLEKLVMSHLSRNVVEPRRMMWSLARSAGFSEPVAGLLRVTPVSGSHLVRLGGTLSHQASPAAAHKAGAGAVSPVMGPTWVEVRLEEVRRGSHVAGAHGPNPRWGEPVDMLLQSWSSSSSSSSSSSWLASSASVRLSAYEDSASALVCHFLGACEIRVQHTPDGGAAFWGIGPRQSVVAARSARCGEPVTLTLPLEGSPTGQIAVRLEVREWLYGGAPPAPAPAPAPIPGPAFAPARLLQAVTPLLTRRVIRITVVEARHLAAAVPHTNAGPLVRLQYGKSLRKTRAAACEGINPVWNESFEVREVRGGEVLKLKCGTSSSAWGSHAALGSARLNLQMLEEGKERELWVPLEKAPSGSLRLRLLLLPPAGDDEGDAVIISSSSSSSQAHGLVEVEVVEARQLASPDIIGYSNPYVSLRFGSIKQRSRVVYKSLSPVWRERFTFVDDGSFLELKVADHNAIMPPDPIGYCYIDYHHHPLDQPQDKWLPLEGARSGELHVIVTRRSRSASEAQKKQPPSQLRLLQQQGNAPGGAKLSRSSHKVQSLLRRALILAHEGRETEELQKMLEELEAAEEEREVLVVQTQRDRDLLVAKVKELEKVMEVIL
eukprot:jgi/Mesen1/10453/ME000082S09958